MTRCLLIPVTLGILLVAWHDARSAAPLPPQDVWLDVDTATGISDVDDGLMLIQAFHSPELVVRGVSVVYGNAPLDKAVPIARNLVSRFGPPGLAVHAGAAAADEFGQENGAVLALADALRQRRLTILAVGPVTNVGTLVARHPELHGAIERIVMVAARRPGQQFRSSDRQERPHRDFNFEHDPAAMQAILDTSIPLVFAPWEVSSQVWLTRDDLEELRKSGPSGAWIAESSQYWIEFWEKNITADGFNPFDTLAVGWVTHPELIEAMRVKVWIQQGPDDRATPRQLAAGATKPYLLVSADEDEPREVIYCYRPRPQFKKLLLRRLAGPEQTRANRGSIRGKRSVRPTSTPCR